MNTFNYFCGMERILMYIIIALFAVLLFVNIYFRIKVMKTLKILRQYNVQFDKSMVADDTKLAELIKKSPGESRKAIADFARYIKRSMTMAILLILMITLFGAVLMYYRKNG